MAFFSALREMSAGLKLGARYAFTEDHGLMEKGVQPRVERLNRERFGR